MVIVFDLDDTLYDEIDFVKSGFKEVSKYLCNGVFYDFMFDDFLKNGSGRVFNNLIQNFNLDIPIQKLIEIYRFHQPNITIPKESLELLEFCKEYNTALISDGYYLMQQNKYRVLKLDSYIEFPVFTDFYHTKKPELKPFELVMNKFKNEKDFIYISDNPKKDFIAPNKLNWKSIRYKNYNGLYKDFESNATFEVESRLEIIEVLKKIV